MPKRKTIVDKEYKKYNAVSGDWFKIFESWQDDNNKKDEYVHAYYLLKKLIKKDTKSEERKRKALAEKLAKELGFELKEIAPTITLEQLQDAAKTHGMELTPMSKDV
jgi:hypothetical protein